MDQPTLAPPLNAEQAKALTALDAGRNVLVTGPAGVGKTYLLNRYQETVEDPETIAVTASTGIAACHLGGMTIHSWGGAGVGKWSARQIERHYYFQEMVVPAIQAAKKLVIDEISMLDGHIFELTSKLCCIARNDLSPFGGLQVIMVGDFGQLAPVEQDKHGFAFETRTWWEMGVEHVELTKVMRASDEWYVWMLRCIRDGHLPPQAEEILRQRTHAFDPETNGATRLMTHNEQADRINIDHLERLPEPERTYIAHEGGDSDLLKQLDETCITPRHLRLRVGSRVMFTRNAPPVFVNGTLGVVVSMENETVHVRIDDETGPIAVPRATWKLEGHPKKGKPRPTAMRKQFPLRLAWAITVHKSQGMTLPRVSADLGDTFAPGQAYVALSRARSLYGLNLERFAGRRSIIAHGTALAFMKGTYKYKPRERRPDPEEDYVL